MVTSFNEKAEETDSPICPPRPGDKALLPLRAGMDRYVLVQKVGPLSDSVTAGQCCMEVLALMEKVPAYLFPLPPAPSPQKASCFVSGDVPSSLLQLFSQQQVLKVLFPAHTCTHTLAITVDYRSPLSCPEYYYTDAKKTPNLSLNTEIKKQQYRKK